MGLGWGLGCRLLEIPVLVPVTFEEPLGVALGCPILCSAPCAVLGWFHLLLIYFTPNLLVLLPEFISNLQTVGTSLGIREFLEDPLKSALHAIFRSF